MSQKIIGLVTEISDPVIMSRKEVKSRDIKKITLTIITTDGQKLYVDLINEKIKFLTSENIKIHTAVSIEYLFKGTNKENVKYNNIFVNSITNLKL